MSQNSIRSISTLRYKYTAHTERMKGKMLEMNQSGKDSIVLFLGTGFWECAMMRQRCCCCVDDQSKSTLTAATIKMQRVKLAASTLWRLRLWSPRMLFSVFFWFGFLCLWLICVAIKNKSKGLDWAISRHKHTDTSSVAKKNQLLDMLRFALYTAGSSMYQCSHSQCYYLFFFSSVAVAYFHHFVSSFAFVVALPHQKMPFFRNDPFGLRAVDLLLSKHICVYYTHRDDCTMYISIAFRCPTFCALFCLSFGSRNLSFTLWLEIPKKNKQTNVLVYFPTKLSRSTAHQMPSSVYALHNFWCFLMLCTTCAHIWNFQIDHFVSHLPH